MLSANSLAQQAGADRRKTANLEVEEVLKEKADADRDLKLKEHEKKMLDETDRHSEEMKKAANRAKHNEEARALGTLSDEESELARVDGELRAAEHNEELELENLKKEGKEDDLRQKERGETAVKNTIAEAEEAEDAAKMQYDPSNPQHALDKIVECEETTDMYHGHVEDTPETTVPPEEEAAQEEGLLVEKLEHVDCVPVVEPASIGGLLKDAVEDTDSVANLD